jgi:hypothetical protein
MYYSFEIIEKSKNRQLVSGSEKTYEKCEAAALKDAEYYKSECHYEITVTIEERCETCGNQKVINVKSRKNPFIGKMVKCPECKGNPPTGKWNLED